MTEAKKTENSKDEINFEAALAEIDEIVNKLESGELPLDESLELFQRGMKLMESCSAKLGAVEGKLKILLEDTKGEFSVRDSE